MPFVTLKSAISLAGKIAPCTGQSQWISCTKSREYSHFLRHINQGIAVGIQTVINDDPRLNTRIEGGVDPVKIIFDSKLKISPDAKLLRSGAKTLIFTTERFDQNNYNSLSDNKNIEIIITDNIDGKVDLKQALSKAYQRGIANILVEGGGEINFSLLRENLVQKLILFYAPIIIGGEKAPSFSGKNGFENLEECPHIENLKIEKIGTDLKLEGYLYSQE